MEKRRAVSEYETNVFHSGIRGLCLILAEYSYLVIRVCTFT